jgi:hypothetical protein
MKQQPEQPQKQTQGGEQTCPNCGMAKSEWQGNGGNGFNMGDKTYCCQGCATGTGCTCK